ncbi:MAG: CheR family methyltransferase [Thermodesulfobacteriota bacterium]
METILNTSANAISNGEFEQIRTLVYQRFGINLTDQKRALVVGRLQKLVRDEGFASFQEYHDHVARDTTGAALDKLVNRISTNYTYFYRESAHFDYFSQFSLPNVVARLKQQNSRDLRIWSAGCSSGEEPYMLAMLLMEHFGADYGFWNGGVLATDISDRVLTQARQGIYLHEQVERMPPALFHKYFVKQGEGQWSVCDRLRREVTFRRFNLMNKQFPFKKPFHVIFCRNVMIYFDKETRDGLIRRFYDFLEPGGYLFIGHSETIGRQQTMFRYLQPAAYQRI